MPTKNVDKIIAAVAEKYGLDILDIKNYPDITDPVVAKRVNEEIARQCRPVFEAWAQAEAESMAHAQEVWVC